MGLNRTSWKHNDRMSPGRAANLPLPMGLNRTSWKPGVNAVRALLLVALPMGLNRTSWKPNSSYRPAARKVASPTDGLKSD